MYYGATKEEFSHGFSLKEELITVGTVIGIGAALILGSKAFDRITGYVAPPQHVAVDTLYHGFVGDTRVTKVERALPPEIELSVARGDTVWSATEPTNERDGPINVFVTYATKPPMRLGEEDLGRARAERILGAGDQLVQAVLSGNPVAEDVSRTLHWRR